MIEAANATEAALLSRRSVRGYRPDPVARDVVEHLLDVAARAPSGTNMQPWNVIALSGDALETFRQGMVDTFLTDVEPDGIELPYYPSPVFEPYLSRRRKIGWDLYGLLGIARGETDKMRAHMVRNLRFFDAPVGLIVTLDARLELGSWVDCGMFLQAFATAARGRGLDTCAMAVFAEFPVAVRRLLGIDPGMRILCGMALGQEDCTAAANALRTDRVPAAAFSQFRGW